MDVEITTDVSRVTIEQVGAVYDSVGFTLNGAARSRERLFGAGAFGFFAIDRSDGRLVGVLRALSDLPALQSMPRPSRTMWSSSPGRASGRDPFLWHVQGHRLRADSAADHLEPPLPTMPGCPGQTGGRRHGEIGR